MTHTAPAYRLSTARRVLELGSKTLLMGVVDASPESCGEAGLHRTLEQRFELAAELLDGGADILDIGGESVGTDRPRIEVEQEIERVVPLIERVVGELDAIVSIDVHKPAIARAAIDAGASVVNDVGGQLDPELAEVCAQTGAALVVKRTGTSLKQRVHDPGRYEDIVGEVFAFLRERIALAQAMGVAREQLIVDPSPYFAKTPAQTVELLVDIPSLHALGCPLLMPISGKDLAGSLSAAPGERLAGTLAALAHGVDCGAHIFRVHDLAAARDYLTVRSALAGEIVPESDLALAVELRHDRRLADTAEESPAIPVAHTRGRSAS